jgi:hypothetical protein
MPDMFGQVLFWVAFAAPHLEDIAIDFYDLESEFVSELEEAPAEIVAVLRRVETF